MDDVAGLEFVWATGGEISDGQLADCSTLFSGHYGRYGTDHPDRAKHGERVRMSPSRQRKLLTVDGAFAALAYLKGTLVAYAFLVRNKVGPGTLTWVTQLVVHQDYQQRRVASRLLHAAWGMSDEFGWGLVTASPYAVRALENATQRRCDPAAIEANQHVLGGFADMYVSYVRSNEFEVTESQSTVNTSFFIDHTEVAQMVANVSTPGKVWTLGELGPGREWLAFVFQLQNPWDLTADEFDRLLADQDSIVREAYARMTLDGQHKWTTATVEEVDFALAHLDLPAGGKVLDLGCGIGRHALEFAKRGYQVVGVDFVQRFVAEANKAAAAVGLQELTSFIHADARELSLGETFDAVVCLYDVIGSFAVEVDNTRIVNSTARHLKPGGKTLISVMNRGLVEARAIHKGSIHANLRAFAGLKPSKTMQQTGEIFDPNYMFFDPDTSLVYRKEQFTLDKDIPCQLIVRDRRYSKEELETVCRAAGIQPLWTRHVRKGNWDADYQPQDTKAKELLLLGEKIA